MHLTRMLAAAALVIAAGVTSPTSALAAARTPVGNDIAWPQCGKSYPTGQAFGIIDLNHGRANDTNNCFASELAWAQKSSGLTSQPTVGVYVNTGNPSAAGASWWPTSDTFSWNPTTLNDESDGYGLNPVTVANPYGDCSGTGTDQACSYVYGYAKAWDDVIYRPLPSADVALVWLDVETTNSWESPSDPVTWPTAYASNIADLVGMRDAFQALGYSVGVYSTASQWQQITGQTGSDQSPFSGVPEWLAGASSSTAATFCGQPPFMKWSRIILTQYVSGRFDYDHSCT